MTMKNFVPTILRFDSIDSTNLEAMRHARSGAPEGLCVVAREQTAGRGRLNRSWHSARDAGLYFSIVLRPRLQVSQWPLLTLMTALAVSDALMRACNLRCDIKWPNDIYVKQRKLCGILAETVETPQEPAAIVGIGINLTVEGLDDGLRELATSIESVTGAKPDNEKLLEALVQTIAERYELLQSKGGDEHTIREWCAASSFAFERRVRVSLNGEEFEGTTRGLESDGALRVETANGVTRSVRAGDVTALRSMSIGE
jgi:BirA family transcriptional regulator, biotin operon repressor / biotin---[acetyl-CoA-carboxylase] ligase